MTEPIITGVAAELIASAASGALKKAVTSVWTYYNKPDRLEVPGRADLRQILRVIDDQVRATLPVDQIPPRLREYLNSRECMRALEHAFAFELTGRAAADGYLIENEISLGCQNYGVWSSTDRNLVYLLLTETVRRIVSAAGVAASYRASPAAESIARDGSLEGYVRAIAFQLRELTNASPMVGSELERLIATYVATLTEDVGFIQPPNFDGAELVRLDALYVVPELFRQSVSDKTKATSIRDVVGLRRAVVLGDPGGGKTTLSSKIAYELAQRHLTDSENPGQDLLPILVVLRDFGRYFEKHSGSITEYVVSAIRHNYQIEFTKPTIEWLLTVGRCYVIFDGLDELLDSRSRKQVARAVSSFAMVYPSTHVLVTSRRVGYFQAPLGPTFATIQLGEFAENQVRDYALKWFRLTAPPSDAEKVAAAEQFFQESRLVDDLRSNPLMLALMCSIYRSEGYIPRNRPDVYERCSRMLFDRWDRQRGLMRPFEFEAHIEFALMHLAYAIFAREDPSSGVTESALVTATTDYLLRWQYEDRALAEHAAAEFVEFCRGRAWVFTDVGLTPSDEVLYSFTHRTFMEYFAASHISRSVPALPELLRLLVPRLRKGEWDVVSQLALQIRAKTVQGGSDQVVMHMLNEAAAERDGKAIYELLGFVGRCMSFLTTSPDVTRYVAEALISGALRISTLRSNQLDEIQDSVASLLGFTESCSRETRELFTESIVAGVAKRMWSTDERESGLAAAVALAACSQGLVTLTSSRLRELLLKTVRGRGRKWYWAIAGMFYGGLLSAREMLKMLPLEYMLVDLAMPGQFGSFLSPILVLPQYVAASESTKDAHWASCREALDLIAKHVVAHHPLVPRGSLAPPSGDGWGPTLSSENSFALFSPGPQSLMPSGTEEDSLNIAICTALAIDAQLVFYGFTIDEIADGRAPHTWFHTIAQDVFESKRARRAVGGSLGRPDDPRQTVLNNWITGEIHLWQPQIGGDAG